MVRRPDLPSSIGKFRRGRRSADLCELPARLWIAALAGHAAQLGRWVVPALTGLAKNDKPPHAGPAHTSRKSSVRHYCNRPAKLARGRFFAPPVTRNAPPVGDMTLTLYNTLTRKKEPFQPIDPANASMRAGRRSTTMCTSATAAWPWCSTCCPHRAPYPERSTSMCATSRRRRQDQQRAADLRCNRRADRTTARQYQEDVGALGCLTPTIEPRATQHIRR